MVRLQTPRRMLPRCIIVGTAALQVKLDKIHLIRQTIASRLAIFVECHIGVLVDHNVNLPFIDEDQGNGRNQGHEGQENEDEERKRATTLSTARRNAAANASDQENDADEYHDHGWYPCQISHREFVDLLVSSQNVSAQAPHGHGACQKQESENEQQRPRRTQRQFHFRVLNR